MTNLLGLPVFRSTVSAMMAAITAPTKPTPITTTTSLPSPAGLVGKPLQTGHLLGVVGLGGNGKLFARRGGGVGGHGTVPGMFNLRWKTFGRACERRSARTIIEKRGEDGERGRRGEGETRRDSAGARQDILASRSF